MSVRNIRIAVAAFVAAVLLLIFAVPRATPPPTTLANPDEAFIDRAGLVRPEFARQWAGGLLNDDRAQIVVYVDRKAPQGDLASWAIQTASDWRIGASKNDTGLVVFVFTEPRIARIDVGYGLEEFITDARARQLLETHLAPAFAAEEYEKGFDALLFAIRKEIGGYDSDSIIARAQARYRDEVPWITQIGIAIKRMPRVIPSIARAYLEGGVEERIGILVASTVGLVIAAIGIAMAATAVRKVVTAPAALRARPNDRGVAAAAVAFEVVIASGVFFVCVSLVAIVMLTAQSLFTREGRFSGAGSAIVWPQAS